MEQSQAQRQFSEASSAYAAGHYDRALSLLDQLDATYPNQPNVIHARAKCLAKLGRREDAQFLAGQLAVLGDSRAEEIRSALTSRPAVAPVQSKGGGKSRVPIAVAGLVAVVVLVVAVIALRPHSDRVSTTSHNQTNQPSAAPASPATAGSIDEATARGTSWRLEKGSVAELVAKHGAPQSWPGEWPAFPLERKTIPNKDYPDGKCDIWVPTDDVRQAYLKQSFHPTPYKGRTATETNVKKDLNQYGYYYSEYPPAYLPDLDYTEYNEEPIYPYIGQMVPGTNIQYTQPPTPAVWLIDLTPDNKTVPALTTIDPRKFRSINWPRQRFSEAIAQASAGRVSARLMGNDFGTDRVVAGIVLVPGDYAHGEGGRNTFQVAPGTVFVMTAKRCLYEHPWGNTDYDGKQRVDLVFGGEKLLSEGTEQRPIIWTDDAREPAANDWDRVAASLANVELKFNLIEYARWGMSVGRHPASVNISKCIFRYTEARYRDGHEGMGIFYEVPYRDNTIRENELHNNGNGIRVFNGSYVTDEAIGKGSNTATVYFDDNVVFNNAIGGIESATAKGIFTGGDGNHLWARRNVFVGCDAGIAPEDYTDQGTKFVGNIIAVNLVGASMYYDAPGEYSRPDLRDNNVWYNYCPWWQWPPPGRVVNFEEGFTSLGGPWIVDEKYESRNYSYDPLFRNILIWDLEPLAGWPEER